MDEDSPSPTLESRRSSRVNIEQVIERLGEVFTPDEAAIAERMLQEYGGTIPDAQLHSEIGLSVAIHRRKKPN